MTLDEKLKQWAGATEGLAPSEALRSKLQAAVDAPAPPAVPSAVVTVVKVLIITALVGAVGYAFTFGREVNWRWTAGAGEPAGALPLIGATPTAIGAATGEVPARLPAVEGSAVAGSVSLDAQPCDQEFGAAMPIGFLDPDWHRRLRGAELRALLASRPLTCLGQRSVLEDLLGLHSGSDAEEVGLLTRLGYLCGSGAIPLRLLPPLPATCDNSDWCRRPACNVGTDEACAARFAARPEASCTHAIGVRSQTAFACARFLRGEGTGEAVRALSPDAWCLRKEALDARDALISRHAVKESP